MKRAIHRHDSSERWRMQFLPNVDTIRKGGPRIHSDSSSWSSDMGILLDILSLQNESLSHFGGITVKKVSKNELQSAMYNLSTLIKNDRNKVNISVWLKYFVLWKKDNVCVWLSPSSIENWNLFSLTLPCPMITCHKNEEEVMLYPF